jgi:hypothetical protein
LHPDNEHEHEDNGVCADDEVFGWLLPRRPIFLDNEVLNDEDVRFSRMLSGRRASFAFIEEKYDNKKGSG